MTHAEIIDNLTGEKQFPAKYKDDEKDEVAILYRFNEKRFATFTKIPISSVLLIDANISRHHVNVINDINCVSKKETVPIRVAGDVRRLFEMPNISQLEISMFALTENSKLIHNLEKYGFYEASKYNRR